MMSLCILKTKGVPSMQVARVSPYRGRGGDAKVGVHKEASMLLACALKTCDVAPVMVADNDGVFCGLALWEEGRRGGKQGGWEVLVQAARQHTVLHCHLCVHDMAYQILRQGNHVCRDVLFTEACHFAREQLAVDVNGRIAVGGHAKLGRLKRERGRGEGGGG